MYELKFNHCRKLESFYKITCEVLVNPMTSEHVTIRTKDLSTEIFLYYLKECLRAQALIGSI